jgi:hypothetical protein
MFTRVLATGCVATLLVLGASRAAQAGPGLPTVLEPPAGHEPYLRTRAVGTQNYACVATGAVMSWKFLGPQATLFYTLPGGSLQQIATHVLSANPAEDGTLRATWQQSFDSSRVWARAIVTVDDPKIVARGAIAWLLLEVVGTGRGPTGGASFAQTTYIQRLDTSGGIAPSLAGCAATTDVGKLAFVPYETDYVFFRRSGS